MRRPLECEKRLRHRVFFGLPLVLAWPWLVRTALNQWKVSTNLLRLVGGDANEDSGDHVLAG